MTDFQLAVLLVVGVVLLGFAAFSFVWMVMVLGRLREIRLELTRAVDHLFAIRHPELPWPGVPPDKPILLQREDGHTYRLRADGQWEVQLQDGGWEQV